MQKTFPINFRNGNGNGNGLYLTWTIGRVYYYLCVVGKADCGTLFTSSFRNYMYGTSIYSGDIFPPVKRREYNDLICSKLIQVNTR